MMPLSGTTINGCDCPGSTPASGVLIDGDIPSIDTTQRGTWGSGLFVVNRNGRDSIVIGFQFQSSFFLRYVEVTYFDCPLLGTGASMINVYSSFFYPSFIKSASTNIGAFSLVDDHSVSPGCSSLRTLSISVQSSSMDKYFIELNLSGGSNVSQLNWLHLAEIRFSDVVLSVPTSFIAATSGEIYSGLCR